MFLITIFKKVKETRLNSLKEVLQKMENYQEAIIKLTNMQINKLKLATKNKTGTSLGIN